MMQAMTGPGLDAELAYRRESVLRSAGHRATRRARTSIRTHSKQPAARTQPVRPRQAA